MKIEGSHVFNAPRQTVWEALLDPQVLARSLPGCEELQAVGENQFKGKIRTKIGPVQGDFEGTVTLSQLQPPESYHLQLDGRGAAGFIQGQGDVRLEDQSTSTLLHYDITAQVGGRIAAVGQRLLDSSSRVITRQSLEQLDRQIEARRSNPEKPAAEPYPPAPTQAQFAAKVAGGVARDLIGGSPAWVIVPSIVLLGFLIFVGIRACA